LSGAIGGAALSDAFHAHVITAYLIVGAVFAAALGCSLVMRRTPGRPDVVLRQSWIEFVGHTGDLIRSARLGRMLLGTALFWVCGAAMKINFQPWGLQVLGLQTNTEIALLGLWLSVGVMIGSVAAGRLHKVGDLRSTPRYGSMLAGALGVLFFVTRGWTAPSFTVPVVTVPLPIAGVLVLTGVAAGLFLIPLNAALQAESDPAKLGKTIAVQNLFDNLGMCVAGAYTFCMTLAGVSPSGVFLGLAAAVGLAMLAMRFQRARAAQTTAATVEAAVTRDTL
jgi:MFS transporter, LPLT family, lysophospholipid transporter